jgi:hypothetical protein
MIILALTLHNMENEAGTLIYLMVDDFEQVSRAINAQPQVFSLIACPFPGAVILVIPEGVQNCCLAQPDSMEFAPRANSQAQQPLAFGQMTASISPYYHKTGIGTTRMGNSRLRKGRNNGVVDVKTRRKDMSVSFRTIGKFCFLLVFIGFFMPITCDMNGFQIANSVRGMGGNAANNAPALYGLFISAIAGLLMPGGAV